MPLLPLLVGVVYYADAPLYHSTHGRAEFLPVFLCAPFLPVFLVPFRRAARVLFLPFSVSPALPRRAFPPSRPYSACRTYNRRRMTCCAAMAWVRQACVNSACLEAREEGTGFFWHFIKHSSPFYLPSSTCFRTPSVLDICQHQTPLSIPACSVHSPSTFMAASSFPRLCFSLATTRAAGPSFLQNTAFGVLFVARVSPAF